MRIEYPLDNHHDKKSWFLEFRKIYLFIQTPCFPLYEEDMFCVSVSGVRLWNRFNIDLKQCPNMTQLIGDTKVEFLRVTGRREVLGITVCYKDVQLCSLCICIYNCIRIWMYIGMYYWIMCLCKLYRMTKKVDIISHDHGVTMM